MAPVPHSGDYSGLAGRNSMHFVVILVFELARDADDELLLIKAARQNGQLGLRAFGVAAVHHR